MKKIVLFILALCFGLIATAQRKSDISIERYYHIQRGVVWFHALGKNFQPVYMGDVKTEEVYIYNSADIPVTLSFDDLPAGYSLEFVPQTIPPKTEAVVKVTLDTEKLGKYGPTLDYFFVESDVAAERPYRMLMSPNILEDFTKVTPEEKTNPPVVEMDKTKSVFGEMNQMSVYEDAFVIKNSGKSQLIIRNVKAGCGCTHTNTSRDTLAPGETAKISFEFHSGHKKGKQDSKITVVTNDPSNPQVTLHIIGEVLVTKTEEEK